MTELLKNKLLWIPLITWFLVQLFKLIYEIITNRKSKINFKRIIGAGGMPSSHTACISSLATSIGVTEGFGSATFALAAVFTFIVMYDAAGVRRAAGKQARVLNKIIETDGEEINVQEKLVEFLGHSPMEVIVGLLVGICMGLLLCHIWDL
ncbi:MAG: divergent PAP2 family protein [Clostridia bacterium]|nr:divergent PAP2 family protein [Clostridia bacterium]